MHLRPMDEVHPPLDRAVPRGTSRSNVRVAYRFVEVATPPAEAEGPPSLPLMPLEGGELSSFPEAWDAARLAATRSIWTGKVVRVAAALKDVWRTPQCAVTPQHIPFASGNNAALVWTSGPEQRSGYLVRFAFPRTRRRRRRSNVAHLGLGMP